MYILFFILISQTLLAQTWEEVEIQIIPDDIIGFHWSSNIYFTNQDTGWISTVGAEKNESGNYDLVRKIYRTEDGSSTWVRKFIYRQELVIEYAKNYAIFSMKPDYFIAMYNDSVAGVLITEDGGETWIDRKIAEEHLSSSISKIHFFDKLNGIAFNEHRWFTSDGGYTWEKSNDTFENRTPSDVCFVNDSLGWMVSGGNIHWTDAGYIANTIDGGKTWQYQDSVTAILSGVDFIDSLKGFAVGTNFRFSTAYIYSTTDGGENWDIQGFYGEEEYDDIGFLDDKYGWILASGGKILRTSDDGENWETQIDNLDCNFGKLIILKEDKAAYAIGYNDDKILVLYRGDLSNITGLKGDNEIIDKAMYLYPNFPNPFNSQTTIKYELNQESYVQLKIFNILGEEVRTLVKENQSPDVYKVCWNGMSDTGKPLESGIYICQLVVNDRIDRRKLILLK
ncbi:T9SS type A sorting domain-containing protein [bacterium]|nr:T9SS type A sorting domain-containing protein [bacterium]